MKIASASQRATLQCIIVLAFRTAGLVLYQQNGETFLQAEESQAKRVQQWATAPHIEEEMGIDGKNRSKLT
jgi:hypothetical protein